MEVFAQSFCKRLSQILKLITKILHVCGFSFNVLVFSIKNCRADVCKVKGWELLLAKVRRKRLMLRCQTPASPFHEPMMSLLLYTFYVPLVDNNPNSTESKRPVCLQRGKLFLQHSTINTVYGNFNQTRIYIVCVQ